MKLKHTAAEYEVAARDCIKDADEVQEMQDSMYLLARAQVYATLAQAAATLEAAEGPVVSTEISEHVDSVMRDRARMIEAHKNAYPEG